MVGKPTLRKTKLLAQFLLLLAVGVMLFFWIAPEKRIPHPSGVDVDMARLVGVVASLAAIPAVPGVVFLVHLLIRKITVLALRRGINPKPAERHGGCDPSVSRVEESFRQCVSKAISVLYKVDEELIADDVRLSKLSKLNIYNPVYYAELICAIAIEMQCSVKITEVDVRELCTGPSMAGFTVQKLQDLLWSKLFNGVKPELTDHDVSVLYEGVYPFN